MSNIIDFNVPDDCHVYTDMHGTNWQEYVCEFVHRYQRFSFKIWARSDDDAEDKINAIIDNGEVVGQVYAEEKADD